MSTPTLRIARDRRGIALPFALIGLVAVSILITSVLLTSSTEFAISAAHRDAATSLYAADGAMQDFVASRVGGEFIVLAAGENESMTGSDGRNYTVSVARLAWRESNPGGVMQASETFSLLTEPDNGRGRSLVAFVSTTRAFDPVALNINAGTTSGGTITISGTAMVSGGAGSTAYCEEAEDADYAVQVTKGSKINVQGAGKVEGAQDSTSIAKADLADLILQGKTLEELAEYAEVKFGMTRWEQADWSGARVSGTNTNMRLNWGCPDAIMDPRCVAGALIDRHVVVAIDARGGKVTLNGDHGQGMLIILNGDLEIQGNFVYKGIILVERDIQIRGGSGQNETKIEGAVVAFGDNSEVADNVTGTATIMFNRCAIIEAQAALNESGLANSPQRLAGGTWAWHEIIR
jgi:hypothetical protein